MNNLLSTNPTTLNLSSLVSVRSGGGGRRGSGESAAESQSTVRDTDRLSDDKLINILKGIRVFKLWSRPGSKDVKRTRNGNSNLNNSNENRPKLSLSVHLHHSL